jgi:hypothetical protein
VNQARSSDCNPVANNQNAIGFLQELDRALQELGAAPLQRRT